MEPDLIDIDQVRALLGLDDRATTASHLDYRGISYMMKATFAEVLIKGRPYRKPNYRRFYSRADIMALKEEPNGKTPTTPL